VLTRRRLPGPSMTHANPVLLIRLSIEDGELPFARIDSGGKYPVQFAPDLKEFLESDNHRMVRRFDVLLRWTDGNGRHEKVVPLRRGQTDQ
jgi:hypothetical protein